MEIGQKVFYMIDSRVHSAEITSKSVVENVHDRWANTKEQKQTWTPFGESGTFYATCHGIIPAGKAFSSKKELLGSL